MSAPYGLDLVKSCVACKLRSRRFFCALPRPSLAEFERVSYRTILPKGSPLFFAGHKANGVHVLCAGKVALSIEDQRGRSVIVRIAAPGEALGLHSCVRAQAHEFTALTVQPCETIFIRSDDFLRILRHDSQVCFKTAQALAATCRSACVLARSLTQARSASERLARFLLEFTEAGTPGRQGVRVEIDLTHSELAQALGIARETLWRKIREFRKLGVASIEASIILIQDSAALRRLAGYATPV